MEEIKKIINYFKTKKGKSISFFGFYLIFFIFLAIYINANNLPSKTYEENKKEEVSNNQSYYETINLEKSNYLYKITIQENDELEILNGTKEQKESIVNYKYYKLIDLNEIKRIIKNAKYLSKSIYSANTYKVNYEIKTKTLMDLFENENNDESLNNIVLTVNENNDLINIEMELSNYMHSFNQDIELYKVLIEYEY